MACRIGAHQNWMILTNPEDFVFSNDIANSLLEIQYDGPDWKSDDTGPTITIWKLQSDDEFTVSIHGMLGETGEEFFYRSVSSFEQAKALAISLTHVMPTLDDIEKFTGLKVERPPW